MSAVTAREVREVLADCTVTLEGVRSPDGKPACNRFAIWFPDDIGHIPFDEEHRATVERAIRCHAQLVEALRAARHDLWLYADAATSDEETIRGEVAIRAIDEALAAACGEKL
jgi:hypothetical protein